MKICVLILLFLTSISCSTFFSRKPASQNSESKPRHVIITIHGLSGNAETWGSFAEVTKKYLPAINPNYEVITSNFIYPTGQSNKLSTFDFAEFLNTHIENIFKDRPITTSDRITLVGHSQGGIVSYVWYFSRLLNDNLDQSYMRQVDSIISLGTPFWGSKLASIATDRTNPDIIPLINLFSDTGVTHKEIQDMAFGSDVINKFRQMAINMDTDPKLQNKLKSTSVRLINIIGLLPPEKEQNRIFVSKKANSVSKLTRKIIDFIYSYFTNHESSEKHIESDIAVMVPSGRWDFIYTPNHQITENSIIQASEFKHFTNLIDQTKFITTESVHIPFDTDNTYSMAYINKSCLNLEDCTHPTYRYVLEQIANCRGIAHENAVTKRIRIQECDDQQHENIIQKLKLLSLQQQINNRELSKTLQTFSIQIDIKLRPGEISKFPLEYFKGSYKNADSVYIWKLQEPRLIGKIINLNRDKNNKSIASNLEKTIYIAPKNERRGLDITSKESLTVNENDYLRMNIVGYIDQQDRFKLNDMTSVPITITLPNLPHVEINAAIQPGYSTYMSLDYTQVK